MKVLCRILSLCLLLNCASFAQQPTRSQAMQRAEAAAAALQTWYVNDTGLYTSTGWWNAANAITALTDYMRASGIRDYEAVLAKTFLKAQVIVPKDRQVGRLAKMTGAPGYLNTYYDDEGWWALAWIDAYDLTRRPEYLAMAQSIFKDMSGGWDDTCGGGIWWSKDRNYKNAIANELFFSVATHLNSRVAPAAGQGYAEWADREWRWFEGSGMVNKDHLVNDGLEIDAATHTCRNNGRTVWTYNQGVLLGGLAEWARLKQDSALLAEAHTLALAGLDHLTDAAGVLHDVCEPAKCGDDAPQFKGIFVRNLRALNAVAPDPRFATFFQANAQSIWAKDRSAQSKLGLVWSGPALPADAATQSSALDALVAAIPAP